MIYLVLSFFCAGLCTFLIPAIFVAAVVGLIKVQDKISEEIFGVFLMVLVLGTTIPGIALAQSVRLPRQPTPIAVWIATIWNILLLGLFILLCVVGLAMQK